MSPIGNFETVETVRSAVFDRNPKNNNRRNTITGSIRGPSQFSTSLSNNRVHSIRAENSYHHSRESSGSSNGKMSLSELNEHVTEIDYEMPPPPPPPLSDHPAVQNYHGNNGIYSNYSNYSINVVKPGNVVTPVSAPLNPKSVATFKKPDLTVSTSPLNIAPESRNINESLAKSENMNSTAFHFRRQSTGTIGRRISDEFQQNLSPEKTSMTPRTFSRFFPPPPPSMTPRGSTKLQQMLSRGAVSPTSTTASQFKLPEHLVKEKKEDSEIQIAMDKSGIHHVHTHHFIISRSGDIKSTTVSTSNSHEGAPLENFDKPIKLSITINPKDDSAEVTVRKTDEELLELFEAKVFYF